MAAKCAWCGSNNVVQGVDRLQCLICGRYSSQGTVSKKKPVY